MCDHFCERSDGFAVEPHAGMFSVTRLDCSRASPTATLFQELLTDRATNDKGLAASVLDIRYQVQSSARSKIINRLSLPFVTSSTINTTHLLAARCRSSPGGRIAEGEMEDEDPAHSSNQSLAATPSPDTFLRFRLSHIETVLVSATSIYDVKNSPFYADDLKIVPSIRIFGATDRGQRVVAHVAGTFPYSFIEYKGKLDPETGQSHLILGSREC